MKKKDNEVAVGVFVILGFVFLTLVLFFVSGIYLFRPGYTIDVMYGYVSILNKGAPVRMAGVKVGEVDAVNLFYDETKQKSRVSAKLFIEKGVEIRENYKFKIQGTHILSEPHIEITPEAGNFPVLHKGDVVEGVELMAVEDLMDRAHEIMNQLASMLKNFNGSESGKGTLKDLKQSIANIESSSASLNDILGKVRNGEGTVGQLLMKDEIYKEMEALVKDVRAHPWKLLKKDSSSHTRKWYFLFLA